jgi:hypothetical protein
MSPSAIAQDDMPAFYWNFISSTRNDSYKFVSAAADRNSYAK